MHIAIVHPDLGIGGAERLVVDAALALQRKGHRVAIYTSHHALGHCFAETKDGTLAITVVGDFLPRHLFGYFHLLFAAVRSLYLAMYLFLCCPNNFDLVIADQISLSIPILRQCTDKVRRQAASHQQVLFYCHFPDKRLAPKSSSWLRVDLYRRFFDYLEEATVGTQPNRSTR